MAYLDVCLFLLYLSIVQWVDGDGITDWTLDTYPNRTVTVSEGETRNFTCGTGTTSEDPLQLPRVAWYKASTQGLVMVRLTEWTAQSSTFTLKNISSRNASLYVCHIDTSLAFRSLHAYSFQLVVRRSGNKQDSNTVSEGEGNQDNSSNESTRENIVQDPEEDTVQRLEKQSEIAIDSSTISLLYVIVVLQLICLIVILLVIFSYIQHRRKALGAIHAKLLPPFMSDMEGGNGTQVTTAASTPVPHRSLDNTLHQRSKSMKPPKKVTDVELELKSLTQKKKPLVIVNGQAEGKKTIQKRAKVKPVVEKRPSNEEEPDLSPSIVPLERPGKGVRYGKHTPLHRLLSEDSGDVKWDTYNSLMEESLTNPVFESEKTKPKRRHKEKTKQPKLSEIDPYVREDDEYWTEMGAKTSTPKRPLQRSKSAMDHPSSPRRVIVPSIVREPPADNPNPVRQKKRPSIDEGVFWPHATGQDQQGMKQPNRPRLMMLHPGLKEDQQTFTPNLVRRLKALYDQGFSIQIT
jgi:hypothetical protein